MGRLPRRRLFRPRGRGGGRQGHARGRPDIRRLLRGQGRRRGARAGAGKAGRGGGVVSASADGRRCCRCCRLSPRVASARCSGPGGARGPHAAVGGAARDARLGAGRDGRGRDGARARAQGGRRGVAPEGRGVRGAPRGDRGGRCRCFRIRWRRTAAPAAAAATTTKAIRTGRGSRRRRCRSEEPLALLEAPLRVFSVFRYFPFFSSDCFSPQLLLTMTTFAKRNKQTTIRMLCLRVAK